MTREETISLAVVTELQRQARESGCVVESNGEHVQVDGSFALVPLARAVAAALSASTEC